MNKYISLSILEEKNLENCLLKEPILKEISFINESLGSFNRQIDIANVLSKEILDMLDNGNKEKDINIEINGEKIDTQLVLVRSSSLLHKTYATTEPYGEVNDGNIILTKLVFTVYISQFDVLSYDRNNLFNKLVSIINNELMHGNIFSKRIFNKQDINIVDWYDGINNIIYNERNDLARNVAYSLYACYFHERQSIISSTYTQLLEIFNEDRISFIRNKVKDFSDEEKYNYLLKVYKENLVKTESYQTFLMIENICKNISNNEIRVIKNIFKGYGINIDLGKEIEKMELISHEAIKDVCRNGSLFFHEYLLKEI